MVDALCTSCEFLITRRTCRADHGTHDCRRYLLRPGRRILWCLISYGRRGFCSSVLRGGGLWLSWGSSGRGRRALLHRGCSCRRRLLFFGIPCCLRCGG